jgi:hypothetical protein
MKDYTKFFDAAYVINLANRTDRWESITEKAQKAGLPITRWEAFPASKVDLEIHRIGNRVKKPSCVACTLSHFGIYRDALEKGYERILILEDDADVPPDLYEKLEDFFTKTQLNDFDLLYLGAADKYPPVVINEYMTLSQCTLLTHAKLMHRRGMERMLGIVDAVDDGKVRMTIDVLLAEYLQPFNKTYHITENIVKIIPSVSDIAGWKRTWNTVVSDCLKQGKKNPKKWEQFEERARAILQNLNQHTY